MIRTGLAISFLVSNAGWIIGGLAGVKTRIFNRDGSTIWKRDVKFQ